MALDIVRIQKDIDGLRKFLKRTPKRLPPEKIHSLRTHSRRLDAMLQALGLDSRANERQVLRKLKKIRSHAGEVRDLDVLTGYAASVVIEEEQECLVELLEFLGAQRYRKSKQLCAWIDRDGAALRRRLNRMATHLATLEPHGDGGPASSAALGDATASALQLHHALLAPARLTKKNLHSYRLQVKDLRYILELETERSDQQFFDALGTIKDAIGEWHDWQQLVEIAEEQLRHGSECKLLRRFRAISKQKYENAVSVTEDLKQTTLRSPAAAKIET